MEALTLSSRRCITKQFAVLPLFFLALISPIVSFQRRFQQLSNDCYDDDGNPKFCEPDFGIISLQRKIVASETCGIPNPESYCKLERKRNSVVRSCDICKQTGPRSHPVKYMTDIHDDENATYWQSKVIEGNRKVVLNISLGKKFELSYISLLFNSPLPASMAIYKSVNHGRTWIPFQYYAQNCLTTFNLTNHVQSKTVTSFEALCLEDRSDPELSGGRILFNPKEYRTFDDTTRYKQHLSDWVTVTDIQVVLDKVIDINGIIPLFSNSLSKRGADNLPEDANAVQSLTDISDFILQSRKDPRRSAPAKPGQVPISGVSQYAFGSSPFYAINDITVAGRCKCNGHASSCIVKNGKLVCNCKHNTDGPDCEKCKAFHFDRPWRKGNRTNANDCVACKCNLHAKKCSYNDDLFKKSGSGGVCERCRHHTTGRFCNNCRPGYYKNSKIKSIANRKICRACSCHPVGAIANVCDPRTGKCPCKEGVAGKRCNKCAKGYELTKSRVAPCIRKAPTIIPHLDANCPPCMNQRYRLISSRFCKYDYVIQAKILEQTTDGYDVKITLEILRYFKTRDNLREKLIDVKSKEHIFSCICPRLKSTRKYLLIGKLERIDGRLVPIIDSNTVVLRWKKKFRRKLTSLLKIANDRHRCSTT